MMVITILVLLTFQFSSAKRFFTSTNKLCVTKCLKSDENYYYCYTGQDSWDYCSSHANVDIYNRKCQNPCDTYGEEFYSCKIELEDYTAWEFCGTHRENFQIVASSGYFCIDECAEGWEGYFWCNTEKGWDYCSPDERSDHYNRSCVWDSFCGKHEGAKYYWCHVNRTNNEWGYCSIHSESKHLTHRGHYCSTECLYNSLSDYFQCRIFDGSLEYCSPLKQTDSRGHMCTFTRCSKPEGNNYYWCYYKNGKWDYCGLLSLDGGCSDYSPDIRLDGTQIKDYGTSEMQNIESYNDFIMIPWTNPLSLVSPRRDCIKTVLYEGTNEVSKLVLVNSKKIRPKRTYHQGNNKNISSESVVLDELHSKIAKSLILQLKGFKLSKYAHTVAREGNMVIKVKGLYRKRRRFLNIKLEFRRPKNRHILDVVAESSVQVHRKGHALFPLRYIHQCLIASLMDIEGRQCCITHRGY